MEHLLPLVETAVMTNFRFDPVINAGALACFQLPVLHLG